MEPIIPNWRRIATCLWVVLALVVAGIVAFRLYEARQKSAATAAAAPPPSAATAATAAAGPDPATALATALALPDPGQRAREFGRQLQAWADRDLEAALDYVLHLPRGASYTQGLLLVLETLSRHDEERALKLAREHVANREERAFYSALFDRLARRDLAAAVARLDLVPGGESRDKAVRAIADVWTARDPAAAFAWAQQLTGPERAAALESTLTLLADTDPLKTIEYAQKSLTSPALERTVSHALERLTLTDPKGASGLVSLLPPGELQTFAALDVARGLATHDPQAALAWIKTLPEGQIQRLALNNALTSWVVNDEAAASQYVARMPAGPDQDSATGYLAALLAAFNPSNAIVWTQTLTSTSAREAALLSIASAWAQKDPPAATQWAGLLPESPLQQAALTGALSYWVLRDGPAAREHVRTLSAAVQPAAAEFVAPLLAQSDPGATLAWAQTLPVPEARDRALAAAYGRWLVNAPDAARAWLATASLPAETKARLAPATGG
jgi:hypothetical protein